MKKKIAIIAGIVFVVLLVLAMLVVLGFKLYDHIKYNDFYDVAEREYYIPGLMEGYVPQGFDYMEEEKVFLLNARQLRCMREIHLFTALQDYTIVLYNYI